MDSIEKALELYEVCPELDYIMLNSEDLESHPLFIWNVTHGITYQQLSTDILKNRYNYLFEWDVLDFENIFEDHVEMFI